MSVKIFCRLSRTINENGELNIDLDRNDTVVSCLNGPYFKFDQIFKDSDESSKIQNSCVTPLINGAINGYNTALLLFGETESGKFNLFAGRDSIKGIFTLTMDEIFNKLETDERFKFSFKVQLCLFEVKDKNIVDLIERNFLSNVTNGNIEYSINNGLRIKEITEVDIKSPGQAVTIFMEAWNRRFSFETKDKHLEGTIFVQIKIFSKNIQEEDKNTISQITLVYFPGDDKIHQSHSKFPEINGGSGLLSVQKLLNDLGKIHSNSLNYGNSILTKLLSDQLGGNCILNVLLCLPSNPKANIVIFQIKTMNNLSKIKNNPIVNTENARRLLNNFHQERNELISRMFHNDTKQESFLGNKFSVEGNINLLKTENVTLKERVDELKFRLEKNDDEYKNAIIDKAKMNDNFIRNEEIKLGYSKRIMDLEIRNNNLKEQLETIRFELQSKILHLEGKLSNYELEKHFLQSELKSLETIKEEKLKLNDKFLTLQKTYTDLQNKSSFMDAKNRELNLEILNVFKRQENATSQSNNLHQEPKPLSPINPNRNNSFKLRLGRLQEELQQSRQLAQKRLNQSSQYSVEILVLKEEISQLKSQIQYLNKNLSMVTEEYKLHLKKSSTNSLNFPFKSEKNLKDEIKNLLNKYDSSYSLKENILKETIKTLTNKLKVFQTWGERCSLEYILLREQVKDKNLSSLDIGTDPKDLLNNHPLPNNSINLILKYLEEHVDSSNSSNVTKLRQQIKELEKTLIIDLEIERAQLLSKNIELKEELLAAQNYINFYLKEKK